MERSIALAYEAVDYFPNRKIHMTNELIHNPEVNDKLQEMNVLFIEKMANGGGKDFTPVQDGDVVILPAFGASYEEMDYFDKKVRVHYVLLLLFIVFWVVCCCRRCYTEREVPSCVFFLCYYFSCVSCHSMICCHVSHTFGADCMRKLFKNHDD